MKRADIEKLAKDMEGIGYEILAVEPECFSCPHDERKILTGAYSIKIAPIRETAAAIEALKNQPVLGGAG